MAASGYTPISLYYSTTASAVPTAGNLANGELALNIADMKLYAKNSAGTVTLLASNASTTGVDSLSFGSTGLTPSTATTGAITVAGTLNVANGGTGLTSLTANRIPYGNGTSAFQSSSALTFDGTSFFGGTNIYASGRFYAQRSSSSLNLPIAGYTDGSAGAVLTGTKGDIVAFGNAGGDGVIFANSNTEQMRLTSTGLGIGTSSPAAKLQSNVARVSGGNATALILSDTVTGSQTSGFGTQIQGWSNNGSAISAIGFEAYGGTNNDTGLGFYTQNTAGGLTRQMTISSVGDVGIGTSSPAQKLEVNTTSGSYQMRLGSGTTNTAYTYDIGRSSVDGYFRFYGNQSAAQGYIFGGANGEYARLDYSGNFGVNVTSLSAKLEVKGAGNTSGKTFRLTDSVGNETFAMIDGGNGYLNFGGFGVGTTTNPGTGAIYATGNITAYYSSDIKFKENVRDIPDALATVNAIGGKLFDWTDEYIESKGGADGYFVQKADFGVVAQDVKKVFPIAVRTRPDGSLAVDYEKLGALAFAAVGELTALVQTLTSRVEALEAK